MDARGFRELVEDLGIESLEDFLTMVAIYAYGYQENRQLTQEEMNRIREAVRNVLSQRPSRIILGDCINRLIALGLGDLVE